MLVEDLKMRQEYTILCIDIMESILHNIAISEEIFQCKPRLETGYRNVCPRIDIYKNGMVYEYFVMKYPGMFDQVDITEKLIYNLLYQDLEALCLALKNSNDMRLDISRDDLPIILYTIFKEVYNARRIKL